MGYDIFNAIAHIAMIILVLEVLFLLVIPILGLGAGGLFASNLIRKRAPRWLPRTGKIARQALGLIEKGCNVAAWPIIRATSLWRGTKGALASLRRQAAQEQ